MNLPLASYVQADSAASDSNTEKTASRCWSHQVSKTHPTFVFSFSATPNQVFC